MKNIFFKLQLVILILTGLALTLSFYFQYVVGEGPCFLCLLQRGVLIGVAIFGIISLFWNKFFFLAVELILAAFGLIFAGRQIWLQWDVANTMNNGGMCVPSNTINTFFWTGHDCAEAGHRWLGLMMSEWSFLFFLFLSIVILFSLYASKVSSSPH